MTVKSNQSRRMQSSKMCLQWASAKKQHLSSWPSLVIQRNKTSDASAGRYSARGDRELCWGSWAFTILMMYQAWNIWKTDVVFGKTTEQTKIYICSSSNLVKRDKHFFKDTLFLCKRECCNSGEKHSWKPGVTKMLFWRGKKKRKQKEKAVAYCIKMSCFHRNVSLAGLLWSKYLPFLPLSVNTALGSNCYLDVSSFLLFCSISKSKKWPQFKIKSGNKNELIDIYV